MQQTLEPGHAVFSTHPGYNMHGKDWTGEIRIIPMPHMPEPRLSEEEWAQAFQDTPPHLIADGTCSKPIETGKGSVTFDLVAARVVGDTVVVRATAYPNLDPTTGLRRPDTGRALDRALICWRPTSPDTIRHLTVNSRKKSLKYRNGFTESEPWLEQPLLGTSLQGNTAVFTDEDSAKNGLTHLKWEEILKRADIETLMAEHFLITNGTLNGTEVKYHLSSDLTNKPAMKIDTWCHPATFPKDAKDYLHSLGRAQMIWVPTSRITRLMMLIFKDGSESFAPITLDEMLEQHDPWDWNMQGE